MRIVIAIALPTTRQHFQRGIRKKSGLDFVNGLRRRFPTIPEDFLWKKVYAPRVQFIYKMCQRLQAYNVEIEFEVTAAKLSELTRTADILFLLAHWKSSTVYEEDILNEEGFNLGFAQLFSYLPSDGPVCDTSTTDKIEMINKQLNTGFENETDLNCSLPEGLTQKPMFRRFSSRCFVDSVMGAALSHGNSLELFDELIAVKMLRELISSKFEGTVDFAVCNSIIAGEVLGFAKPYFVRVNEKPATIESRLAILELTLRKMQADDLTYISADNEVRIELLDHFIHSEN